MTNDILIRAEGRAGRITLNRPKALNALTWNMVHAIETALDAWRDAPGISLVIIDAAGDRAFCSGGDIADLYEKSKAGDIAYGRDFWTDEYRLNAKIKAYPKPVVTFLQGFTMGGGVGIGCHASHRIVGDTSQIAMPECSIGLVPDVGGSLILAQAPGHLGEYIGLTGDRLDAADAIFTGFADTYAPEATWNALKANMIATGKVTIPDHPLPTARLSQWSADIDNAFAAPTLSAIESAMGAVPSAPLAHALDRMQHNAPLAMAVSLQIIRATRENPTIATALDLEFRYTARAVAQGDFIEGIRAAIIDRDRKPKWKHANWDAVTIEDIAQMTAPLERKS